MAYNIFWKIKFKSLRAGTDYTVNIYKDGTLPSGYPLTLTGGASPFTTDENNSDDQFVPIRTQSGYIRIVDNGTALNANNQSVSFNWKDILPSNDTDRPVTLTDGSNNVLWCGFMQAQNFGGALYGNPQEREYPIQCPLTITEGTDINYQNTELRPFAYLLKQIIDSIPSLCRPNSFVIQGGDDAQAWLLKRIDWQNFVDVETDTTLSAKYNMYQCLEDFCKFWGWTARTKAKTLYLTCADDNTETNALVLTEANLTTMAGGTAAGSVSNMFSIVELTGDIFASNDNDDSKLRGPNKSMVKVNCNAFDETIYESFPDSVTRNMESQGWAGASTYDDTTVNYTNSILSFNNAFISATAVSGNGSFNLATFSKDGNYEAVKVIRILKTYNGNAIINLESHYEHLYDGHLIIKGYIYQRGTKYEENKGTTSNKHMKMAIGIGKTKETSKWYTGGIVGSWSSTKTIFDVVIGLPDSIFKPFTGEIVSTNGSIWTPFMAGKLFIELYGSEDLVAYDGQRLFDLADMSVSYTRFENETRFTRDERKSTIEYSSSNGNDVRQDWNADCIYATDNYNMFGFGTVINNADAPTNANTYLQTISYNGGSPEHPEQHLANRVTSFWSTAKRKIYAELRSNLIADITPRNKVTIDSSTMHPISISRNWRDDIAKLTLLEM